MPDNRGQLLFLASVTSRDEARIVVAHGADIIDCKNPSAGALGALAPETVSAIRHAIPFDIPVSATVGDLVPEVELVIPAIETMARAGADIVKIGFFPGGDSYATVNAAGEMRIGRTRLVGLLLADRAPDFGLIATMGEAGFAGAMLDTAGKGAGTLTDVMNVDEIARFVAAAHRAGMFAGLAGSLRLSHIPALAELGADVLGFRGALCRGGVRIDILQAAAVDAVGKAIASASSAMRRIKPATENEIVS